MIEATVQGRVLHIALNRPEKRNALNHKLCTQLLKAFDDAEEDGGIGTIVLSGNGPAFCAGMDLNDDSSQLTDLHERLFTTINRIRKPVIAAVHGAALAGGTGLAANAHIVVAAADARFGLTEIRIGLWPVLVFRACSLAMGERRTTELSLTGRLFGAEEATQYGLVTEIAPDPLQRAYETAASIAEYSPTALREGLAYVNQIRNQDWRDAGKSGQIVRDRLMAGSDFRKAVEAFFRKH